MPTLNAVATSLFVVTVLALTTTASYALSGLVDVGVSLQFIAGGVAGGFVAVLVVSKLSRDRMVLERVFSLVVVTVALYLIWKGIAGFETETGRP